MLSLIRSFPDFVSESKRCSTWNMAVEVHVFDVFAQQCTGVAVLGVGQDRTFGCAQVYAEAESVRSI